MFVELIATLFAGIACAGIAMLVNIASGRRLPRWILPVCAGLGMLGMTISNEYTWFDRTAEQLPEGVEIAVTVDEQSWLRPWTQVWPYTKRFVAVDTAAARSNDKLPQQRLTDLYFFGRWSPVSKAPALFDCSMERMAILIDGARFDQDGKVVNADWQTAPDGDPLLSLVCKV